MIDDRSLAPLESGSRWSRDRRLPWPFAVPVLFATVLAVHHGGGLLAAMTSRLTPWPTVVEQKSRREEPPPPPPVQMVFAAPAVRPATRPPAVESQAPIRKPAPKSRPITVSPIQPNVPAAPPTQSGPVTSVSGDQNGIQIHRSAEGQSPGRKGTGAPVLPTPGDLEVMEFVIDVSPGSIEELVRNLDGAFVRAGRLYDVRGANVSSVGRFSAAGRLIVFYAVDGGLEVVLPGAVVEAILGRVVRVTAGSLPRRVTANFNSSGELKSVDVEG